MTATSDEVATPFLPLIPRHPECPHCKPHEAHILPCDCGCITAHPYGCQEDEWLAR